MKFTNIIAAIDLNDDFAGEVVHAANDMARKDNAQLALLTVWPILSAAPPGLSGEVAAGAAALSQTVIDQHKAGRTHAASRLQAIAEKSAPGAKVEIADGDAADAVSEYAKKMGADLIVVGSHQRGFWKRILEGSASRELLQEAPCAVLVITKACLDQRKTE